MQTANEHVARTHVMMRRHVQIRQVRLRGRRFRQCGKVAEDCVGTALGTERLKPEGMGKPLKEFIATVMVHDRLRDNRAKARHPYGKPCRHASAMQRKIGAATSPSHHAPQEGT
jgi:hypothetical protein